MVEEETTDPREERKENIIAVLIVVAVIATIGYLVWSALQPEPVQQDESARVPMVLGNSPSLGNASAPVVVVEFSDFQCPYCAAFSREYFPRIKEEQIDTGRVFFTYKHFPIPDLHPRAAQTSLASECAKEQDAFWQYHDLLYENQDDVEIEQLVGYAADVGLNTEEFRTCLVNGRYEHFVVQDKNQGISAGVTGTPTFFFNGRKVVGMLTPEQFAAEVERELVAGED